MELALRGKGKEIKGKGRKRMEGREGKERKGREGKGEYFMQKGKALEGFPDFRVCDFHFKDSLFFDEDWHFLFYRSISRAQFEYINDNIKRKK